MSTGPLEPTVRPADGPPSSARLEALSDAVIAFAATLLVVSLEVPATLGALRADLSGFIAFGISFGALVAIWSTHAAYFRRVPVHDGLVVALNGLLLFVLLFYVYPLKLLSRGLVASLLGSQRGTEAGALVATWDELGTLFVLYGLGFVAVFACLAALYLHAWRRYASFGLTGDRRHLLFLARHYALFVAVGAVSVALATTGIGLRVGLPGWIYCLLGPLCWWHGARWGRRGRG